MRLGGLRSTARQPEVPAIFQVAQRQRHTQCRIKSEQSLRKLRQSRFVVMASGESSAARSLLPTGTVPPLPLPNSRRAFQRRCWGQQPMPRTLPTRSGGRRAAVALAALTSGALCFTRPSCAWSPCSAADSRCQNLACHALGHSASVKTCQPNTSVRSRGSQRCNGRSAVDVDSGVCMR